MTDSLGNAVSRSSDNLPPVPFRIKVCGVRRIEDLDACVASGVDCVGLNLYPPSVRYVDPAATATLELADQARQRGLRTVGVAVNETVDDLCRFANRLQLHAIQLHGDETPAQALELAQAGVPVIRAVRLPTGPLSIAQMNTAIEPWHDVVSAILLDADAGSAYGGGGHPLDWGTIAKWSASPHGKRRPAWTLAGGLNPNNVAEAILHSHATSLDVASGTESPKGTKSAARIARFAQRATEAWTAAPNRANGDR